jgi:hypothetical protein
MDKNLEQTNITEHGEGKECTVALRFPCASTVATSQNDSVPFCTQAFLAPSIHNLSI